MVILPPIVTSPVTSKFPVILVSALTLTVEDPLGSIIMFPVAVLIVFPASTRLPVLTVVGLTIVVLEPSVKLIPVKLVTSNAGAWNDTLPVSKSTVNKSPIR